MGLKENFRKARKSKKMKYAAIGETIGMSAQTLANTLSRDNMRTDTAQKIADALGCDLVLIDKKTGEIF